MLSGLCLISLLLGGAPESNVAERNDVIRAVAIGGEVRFNKNAPIFLRLLEPDEAKQERVARERVIELSGEDAARGAIRYEFNGLQPGRYAVKCFQDTNGNGKLDVGMFGPKEPWATFRLARPKLRAPRFEEMAFDASQDVTDADLLLR
ncbi:MAG: DUF2141 domain-containing protein [Vicinamibacteria bacterium]|nr:DUF2141 domain-containing protein [Vicinamibacteria bacterium]